MQSNLHINELMRCRKSHPAWELLRKQINPSPIRFIEKEGKMQLYTLGGQITLHRAKVKIKMYWEASLKTGPVLTFAAY